MNKKIKLPSYMQDGMVFQQLNKTEIYGLAEQNEKILIKLECFPKDGHKVSSQEKQYGIVFSNTVSADQTGCFKVQLPEIKASLDYYKLHFIGQTETLILNDLYFGEVWLVAGSSNMASPISTSDLSDKLHHLPKNPYIRIYTDRHQTLEIDLNAHYSFSPQVLSTTETWLTAEKLIDLNNIAAVPYIFAAKLFQDIGVPIGIIDLACEETYLHAWLPRASIIADNSFVQHIKTLGFFTDKQNWNSLAENNQHQIASIYNQKLAPLQGIGLRGILWQQGEKDVAFPSYYKKAFPEFLKTLKNMVQSPNQKTFLIYNQLMPFLYADLDYLSLTLFNEMLAVIRRSLPLTAALLTTYDAPLNYQHLNLPKENPLYPISKSVIASKMEILSLGLVYNKELPNSSPECVSVEKVGQKLILSFENIGNGLVIKDHEQELKGLAVCGQNRIFYPAKAMILFGVRLLVWHDEITDPEAVTYAFTDLNQDANLIADNRIAVVPFRVDVIPSDYCKPMPWLSCDVLKSWVYPEKSLHYEDLSADLKPSFLPLWNITEGEAELKIETINKSSGNGSLLVKYQRQVKIGLEPKLTYASFFPPLDLSRWENLIVEVFNPDHQIKNIQLMLKDQDQRTEISDLVMIKDELGWQSLTFPLNNNQLDYKKIKKLRLIIHDSQTEGQLYINDINLKIY